MYAFNQQDKFYSGAQDSENLPVDDDVYVPLSQSAVLPISLGELCNHLKIALPCDNSLETYYQNLISAVIRFAEQYTWRDIQRKTWEYFPEVLKTTLPLRKSPFREVDKIEVFSGGAFVAIDSGDYSIKKSNIYPCVVFDDDFECPDADNVVQPYKVTFQTGYIDTDSDVLNPDLKLALLGIIASLNQYRGDCIGPASTECFCSLSNVPPQAKAILDQYRILEI